MRVRIDFELCQSHGVCMEEAPEVFQVLDDGSVSLLMEEPPEALREKVHVALRSCPTGAIAIDE
jgi:ferredoxin